MKNLFRAIVILIPFLLFSCFEFVGSGTAKRTLQLALAAPGDVAKLHIGVFEGVATEDKLLYKNSVAAGSSIPLELPAGDNRIVVVWAEGFDGLANYFGSIGPISIDENGNTPLPIQMIRFNNNALSFNLLWNNKDGIFNWNGIPGALTYELAFVEPRSNIAYDLIVTVNNYQTTFAGNGITDFKIRILSSVFGIESVWSN